MKGLLPWLFGDPTSAHAPLTCPGLSQSIATLPGLDRQPLKPWLDNLTLSISWAVYAKDSRFISAPPPVPKALWNKIEGTVIIPMGNRGLHGFHDLSEA